MSPKVSVIIVNYNAGDRLQKCLTHLEVQTFKDFDVTVIDNASHDGSERYVEESPLGAKLIRAGGNIGFAAGNNRAAESVKGEWLAFLNPDAYAAPDWLSEFVKGTERHPDVEAFGSAQINAADPTLLDGVGDVYHILGIPYRGYFGWDVKHLPPEGEVFAPCGAAAFYKSKTFRDLGGFEERFFCYGEDVDLGFRLRLAGGRIIQLPNSVVYHEGSGVTGRHSDFTIYHGHRNRIWLAYKNTPFWLYWPFLPLHLMANLYLLFRAPKAGITKPYFRGILDGYKGIFRFQKDRKVIQRTRKVSYKTLFKAIERSPTKLFRREGRNW